MKFPRLFPAFLASGVLTLLTAAASPADGSDVPSLVTWRLHPAHPCVQDEVALIVRGFHATPCDSFIGAEAVGPGRVRVRTQVHDLRLCFVGPTEFFDVPVALGRFPAGPNAIEILSEIVHVGSDGGPDTARFESRLGFDIAAECLPPVGDLPFVNGAATDPRRPCAEKPTTLVLFGEFRDGCGRVVETRVIDPGHVALTLDLHPDPAVACPTVITPWKAAFPLGHLEPGGHRVEVELTVRGPATQTYRGIFDFRVAEACDPPPPPGLPYVDAVRIGPKALCGFDQPICPNDSIQVLVQGQFPDNCHFLRRVELVPSDIVGPAPEPPILRLLVDDGGCLGRPCTVGPVLWYATATLPPLPTRRYGLMVQLGQVSCSDEFPPVFDSAVVPFAVASADSCRLAHPPCLEGRWDHAERFGECDAGISRGHAARVTFRVRSDVALSGLQGALVLDGPGLQVTGLEAIGPAAGMHLDWTPTLDGARFVLFAQSGAPIPPTPGGWDPRAAAPPSNGVAVLRVTLEAGSNLPIPPVSRLSAGDLLGSDVEGQGIRDCPPPPCVRLYFPPDAAVICSERACDFNGDGDADVRDLVLMIHCVNGEGPCPDRVAERFDCDGDRHFGIPDVLCCALHVLRGERCPECRADSVRVEPGVRVTLGAPRETGAGLDLPVRVEGTERLGAARLALGYPSDRYDLSGVALDGSPADWLELHQVGDGRISIGLIRTRSAGGDLHQALDLVVHLALKPGQTAGGEVRALEGDFSGPDGVRLEVRLDEGSRPLGPGLRLALSENRPDPFSGLTRFDLALEAAADVEVGVYDVTGRRVALLHRGRLSAGTHPLAWDGRTDGGLAAPNGLYFYRAVSGDQVASRRMTLLRGD